MKSFVIMIIVLAIAGGTWWFTGGQEDMSKPDVSDAATTESANDTDGSKDLAVEEAGGSSESDDSAMTIVESGSIEPDETVVTEDTPSSESSPFAVVDTEEGQAVEPAVVAQPQIELPDVEEEVSTVVESTQQSLEPIEVPSSYPVTDAAKYFIPKEERGPGRLGGPPPLNFPGGPSDPNRDTTEGGVFQPPAAPGQ